MLEVIHYDEEKYELHARVNGNCAVLSVDPQSPMTGIWMLIFKAMAVDAVAQQEPTQVK